MLKLKSSKHFNKVLVTQNTLCCFPNRGVLLIFSLLCTIIVLTQQAVALPKPSTVVQAVDSSPNFLEKILPEVNVNNSRMLSVLEQETGFNQAGDILTPGQQVINAVPDKERGNFIMYELVIALKNTGEALQQELQQELQLKNLEDIEQFYGKRLTALENVPIYENFSGDLLQWIEQKFNLTHQNVYHQLRSRSSLLCTPNGVCYNSKDIPCYCCPF